MYERSYGSKYDGNLSTKEIAKLVRADIKAAVAAGELPEAKYSVRMDRFAGGSSIDIEISEKNPGDLAKLVNPVEVIYWARFSNDYLDRHYLREYDEGMPAVVAKLEAMLKAYNHDGSDSMTDYFDVNFYGHVRVNSDITDNAKPAIMERYARGVALLGEPAVDFRNNAYGAVHAIAKRHAAGALEVINGGEEEPSPAPEVVPGFVTDDNNEERAPGFA